MCIFMYNIYILVDKIYCMANIHMHLSLTARGSYPKQTEYWQMLKSKQFFFLFVKCRVRKIKKMQHWVKSVTWHKQLQGQIFQVFHVFFYDSQSEE